jgi:hypothetical protein
MKSEAKVLIQYKRGNDGGPWAPPSRVVLFVLSTVTTVFFLWLFSWHEGPGEKAAGLFVYQICRSVSGLTGPDAGRPRVPPLSSVVVVVVLSPCVLLVPLGCLAILVIVAAAGSTGLRAAPSARCGGVGRVAGTHSHTQHHDDDYDDDNNK